MATKEEMILAVKAVQNGFLSQQQVQHCMDIQRAVAEKGKNVPLEKIFLKKEFISPIQLRFLLTGDGVAINLDDPAECNCIPGYEIFEKVGQGGMASVFAAYSDARDGEEVALKVLFPHHYINPRFVEGFLNEAKLLSELDHPNLVRGYDYGKGGELYYMALEYVDGQSVQETLDEQGKLEEDLALFVVLQCARALDYLGTVGITHRDIKPDNMLINSAGEMKLIDLGFAKDASTEEEEGVTCGTVQYISPEQARGRSDVDIRSDIYSLGATLYHLVIGEVPFSGNDNMDVMAKQVMAELSSEKTKGGDISHHMHYFIEKMMAKERDIRYQSPAEIIEDIEAIVSGNRDLQFDGGQTEQKKAGSGTGIFDLGAIGGGSGRRKRRGSGSAPAITRDSGRRRPGSGRRGGGSESTRSDVSSPRRRRGESTRGLRRPGKRDAPERGARDEPRRRRSTESEVEPRRRRGRSTESDADEPRRRRGRSTESDADEPRRRRSSDDNKSGAREAPRSSRLNRLRKRRGN